MKLQIKQPIDTALQALSEKQREIIVLRYGLDGKKVRTLQEIAEKYSLTRERIRQIQNIALKRLKDNDCVELLSKTVKDLEKALYSCGGTADEETLCFVCNIATNSEKNYVHLLLDLSDSFFLSSDTDTLEKFWYADPEHKESFESVMKQVHQEFKKNKNAIISDDTFKNMYSDIVQSYDTVPEHRNAAKLSKIIDSNIRDEWGLKKHPEVALTNIAGYIHLVLRDADEPLHFSDITKRITKIRDGRSCSLESCHNELVRNDNFILVGRGLYALKNAGYFPGTICDVIITGMQKRGPMTRKEVLDYVLEHRQVKPQSVIISLYQKDKFTRDKNGRYQPYVD